MDVYTVYSPTCASCANTGKMAHPLGLLKASSKTSWFDYSYMKKNVKFLLNKQDVSSHCCPYNDN